MAVVSVSGSPGRSGAPGGGINSLADCHRFAQFRRAGLINRFGLDFPMPTLLSKLKPCNIGDGLSGPQCQLAYFDRLMPERQAAAIARGGLPPAWQVDWHSRRD